METKILQQLTHIFKKWREGKTSLIDQRGVMKQVYQELEISSGYFFILALANLIALSGLITNSAPVIIGAMLISPLMGPILSFGFAFITGDKAIWDKSLRKIAVSVALTIVISAIATFISPLQDLTVEILSRTKPHLYDLIIAFLAGTAGVAIATAVIPPLSVAGFGIGSGDFSVFLGGFFLFFTNFVAIIITTCAVFYFYGFKPAIISETEVEKLKKRVTYLAIVLFIISIPLIYTLYKSVSEARLRRSIDIVLRHEFNVEKKSRLSTFDYLIKDKKLEINAIVNTIEYFSELQIKEIEKNLAGTLKRDLKINLEEVKVHSGGLKEEVHPVSITPKSPQEIINTSRESVIPIIRRASVKVEQVIAPSTIEELTVGFHENSPGVSIGVQIKRDSPLSEEEVVWLSRLYVAELNLPVDLSVATVPFIPLLVFKNGETALSDAMKNDLAGVKDIFKRDKKIRLLIEAYLESSGAYSKRVKLAEERVKTVTKIFIEEYGIPPANIKTAIIKKKSVENLCIKVTVIKEVAKL